MTTALWFAGLLGLIVAAAISSSRGRASPNEVARRSAIAVAVAAYAGLIIAAVWTWGGSIAIRARGDRLAEGAAVQVTVRGVRVPFAHPLAIGHGRAADATPGTGPSSTAPGFGAATTRDDAVTATGGSIVPGPALGSGSAMTRDGAGKGGSTAPRAAHGSGTAMTRDSTGKGGSTAPTHDDAVTGS